MDILLSSFCFNTTKTDMHPSYWSGKVVGTYQSMPPVCFRNLGATFEPDYSIFFLGNTFYVDCETMEKIESQPLYGKHKELFKAIHDIGKLQIVDYAKIIEPYSELISKSYHNDLDHIVEWKEEFIQLINLWKEFINYAKKKYDRFHDYNRIRCSPALKRSGGYDNYYSLTEDATSIDEILKALSYGMIDGILDWRIEINLLNWEKSIPDIYKEYTIERLAPYLKHISSNLCLAEKLNAVIHDWADITPLYRKKLINSIRPSTIQKLDEQEKCKQLIKLMFPDFQPQSMGALVTALTDKRVESLRQMITEAVNNNVEFDNEFANATLKEIISKNQQVSKYRRISGWLTLPLSLIPWAGTPLEKGAQLLSEKIIEKKIMKSKSWFFLLSEINIDPQKVD